MAEVHKKLVKWKCYSCGNHEAELVNAERRKEIDTKAATWPTCECGGKMHWTSIGHFDPEKAYLCSRCGEWETRGLGDDKTLCFTCGFWREKCKPEIKDSHRSLRTPDGQHYWVGDEGMPSEKRYIGSRGHAGRLFRIKFDDGRYVMSTNLWSQGLIPNDFREELPPNGRFLGEKEYDGEYSIING